MDTLVSKREADDNKLAQVAGQVVIAVQKCGGGVSAYRYSRCVERVGAVSFCVAGFEQLAIAVGVAFVVLGTLSVCYR